MDEFDIEPAGSSEYDLYADSGEYALPLPPPRNGHGVYEQGYADGTPASFVRVTEVASALSDQTRLADWRGRRIVDGLNARPDLLISARGASERGLGIIATEAATAAGADTGRNAGTGLHAHATAVDGYLQFLSPDTVSDLERYLRENVPPQYQDDLRAYAALMFKENIYPVGSPETLVVHPELSVAGRYDKMGHVGTSGTHPRKVYILDIKTSQHRPGTYDQLQIGMQLALYAHAPLALHDKSGDLEWRLQPQDISTDVAYVIWVPAGRGQAELIRWDIAAAWSWVDTARSVLGARRQRGLTRKAASAVASDLPQRAFLTPHTPALDPGITLTNPPGTEHEDPVLARLTDEGKVLYRAIRGAATVGEIGALYDGAVAARIWDEALSPVAQARFEELQELQGDLDSKA